MSATITAMKMKSGRSKRVVVHMDGSPPLTLASVLAATLSVGQTLDEAQIADLRARQEQEDAYQRALSLLSRRPRSEHELEQYFRRRGVGDAPAARVMERLREQGLVNDRAFAQAWVENRTAFHPRGPWALRVELRQKGITTQDIDAALEDFDQEAAAYQAASKAARRWSQLSAEDFRNRLGAYLARRGFDYPILPGVIAQLESEIADAGDESEDAR